MPLGTRTGQPLPQAEAGDSTSRNFLRTTSSLEETGGRRQRGFLISQQTAPVGRASRRPPTRREPCSLRSLALPLAPTRRSTATRHGPRAGGNRSNNRELFDRFPTPAVARGSSYPDELELPYAGGGPYAGQARPQGVLLAIRARKLCPKNQSSRAERHPRQNTQRVRRGGGASRHSV